MARSRRSIIANQFAESNEVSEKHDEKGDIVRMADGAACVATRGGALGWKVADEGQTQEKARSPPPAAPETPKTIETSPANLAAPKPSAT